MKKEKFLRRNNKVLRGRRFAEISENENQLVVTSFIYMAIHSFMLFIAWPTNIGHIRAVTA